VGGTVGYIVGALIAWWRSIPHAEFVVYKPELNLIIYSLIGLGVLVGCFVNYIVNSYARVFDEKKEEAS